MNLLAAQEYEDQGSKHKEDIWEKIHQLKIKYPPQKQKEAQINGLNQEE